MNKDVRDLLCETSLTPSLAFLAAYAICYSNNWYIYSESGRYLAVAILLIAALLLSAVIWGAKRFVIRFFPVWSPGAKTLAADLMILLFSSWVLTLLLRTSLPWWFFSKFAWTMLVFAAFGCLYFFKQKLLNGFLLILIMTSSALTLFSILLDPTELPGGRDEKITLQMTPNIYLFILESYHGLEVLKNVYGIDTTDIEDSMEEMRFKIYRGTYSNSPYTLRTLVDLFAMRPLRELQIGNGDVRTALRAVIGGSRDNFLFKTLHKNEYFIESRYLNSQDYYFNVQGPYLDRSDKVSDVVYDVLKPLTDICEKFEKLPPLLADMGIFKQKQKHYSLEQTLTEVLDSRNGNEPYFCVIKTGALHTPSDVSYTWEKRDEWLASKRYNNAFEQSFTELKQGLRRIVAADPNAIILLTGDHGSQVYSKFLNGVGSNEELADRCAKNGITIKDLADDYFNVFFAVRWSGENKDISAGLPMSPLNYFWHVFAAINNDPAILGHRSQSYSVNRGFVFVVDGKINESLLNQ
jgi:hypothetical protein